MTHPKVKSVTAVASEHALIVTFDNKQRRKYDVRPLLQTAMFAPLKNPARFKTARVEQGGYAVAWGPELDLSEHELWTRGQPI